MLELDINKLKRNDEIIKSYFKVVGDITLTTKDIKIMFPSRYVNRGLASLGTTVKVLSIYAVIDTENDIYSVCVAPIIQPVLPYNISEITINGDLYTILDFKEGDVVIPNNNLVVSDGFMYELYDEFYIKGNIPWFITYDNVSNLLTETNLYAGSNIGSNMLTFEILAATISRDMYDKDKPYRLSINSNKDKDKQPAYVGLNNIIFSYDTTVAKLVGGYFGYGVTVALVSPEKTTSNISDILRS